MNWQQVFMVRGGTEGTGFFNTNFEVKVWYLLGVAVLIWLDWRRHRRTDYLRVLRTGTIVWSLAELVLQVTGTRVLAPVVMFGWPVPFLVQVVLKGAVEGAGVAVFCLFFSDRVSAGDPAERRTWGAIFAGLLLLMLFDAFRHGVHTPAYGGVVPSRRAMFEIGPLLFLVVSGSVAVGWAVTTPHPELRRRAFAMFACMLVFGTVWTLAERAAGTRWIEVGAFGASRHAPAWLEIGALAFDVVMEIAIVYVTFFAIPVMRGHIRPTASPAIVSPPGGAVRPGGTGAGASGNRGHRR